MQILCAKFRTSLMQIRNKIT